MSWLISPLPTFQMTAHPCIQCSMLDITTSTGRKSGLILGLMQLYIVILD